MTTMGTLRDRSKEYKNYHLRKEKEIAERAKSFDLSKFVDVYGYEGYYKVNEDGVIINVSRMKEVKPFLAPRMYSGANYRVRLCKDGKHRKYTRSHIVYRSFYGDFDSSELVIDHIDHNPLNDNYKNLQAITQSENIRRRVL